LGLGLTIARDLARAQNGSLDPETVAEGMAFLLRLRVAAVEARR
jgi:C4-dicarboxylate-specific signal transduction histidine kinase